MNAEMIVWPGGEHPFRLALAQLEGLQQKTDCGPEWLAMRLRAGQWTASEAFEILRWGLIGGGMKDADAKKAVTDAFDRHPIGAFKVPALTVILAALYGPPDDEVGKSSLAGETAPNSENAESGNSAPSTGLGRRRVSRPKKSAK